MPWSESTPPDAILNIVHFLFAYCSYSWVHRRHFMLEKHPDQRAEPLATRRKTPRQHRSKLTVQSILQATLEIAAVEGFLNLGTRHIAERAGVSVGSLYQ